MNPPQRCKRQVATFLTILILSCIGTAQVQLTPSHQVQHALAFIDSPDAPGTLDANHLRQCFSLLAQRLKLPDSDLPHVVVIHVSPEAAHAADVRASCVRRNAAGNSQYYEFWIVGRPKPAEYARFLYTIFEQHYNLTLSIGEQQQVAAFVTRLMSSTVNASGGSH